jgi:hypothetical protein
MQEPQEPRGPGHSPYPPRRCFPWSRPQRREVCSAMRALRDRHRRPNPPARYRRLWAAFPGIGCSPTPGNGGYDAVAGYLAYAQIATVRNIDISRIVGSYAGGPIQGGRQGRPVITRESSRAISRHRGDNACGGHFPDQILPAICEIEVTHGVERYIVRECQR